MVGNCCYEREKDAKIVAIGHLKGMPLYIAFFCSLFQRTYNMNRWWLLVFLMTAVIFTRSLIAGNTMKMQAIRSRRYLSTMGLLPGVSFDDKPSIVFKPLFTDKNVR